LSDHKSKERKGEIFPLHSIPVTSHVSNWMGGFSLEIDLRLLEKNLDDISVIE
jgi:hypothetical protein